MPQETLTHRPAKREDLEALKTLMDAAISENQKAYLDESQIASSRAIMGLDTQLIDDGTYFIIEINGQLAGCGGWSRRATMYGGDQTPGRSAALLDPAKDPARIRAMYTHPAHTRKGIGKLIISLCEDAAKAEGFTKMELVATLSGEPLYRACGFEAYENITDDCVKTALLAATVKLFFQRPPEMQQMLGRLLKKATEDSTSQDLHDRALFYYRLLRSSPDPNVAKSIIASKSMSMTTNQFAEEDDSELRAALLNEFNTLCTVYRCKAENFIEDENIVKFVKMPKEHPLSNEAAAVPVADPGINTITAHLGDTTIGDTANVTPAAQTYGGEVDLLGFGDDTPIQSAPPPSNSNSLQSLALKSSVTLSGEEYQNKWGAVSDLEAVVISSLPMRSRPTSTDAVESALGAFNVMTMASGELETEFKFFLYCQEEDYFGGSYFLIQAVVTKAPSSLSLTIKPSGGNVDSNKQKEKIDQLVELIRSALGEYFN